MSEISKDEVIERIANSGAQPFGYEGPNSKFHIAHFEVDLSPEALQLVDQDIRNIPNQTPEALEEQLLVRNPRGRTFIMPKLSGLLKQTVGDRNNSLVAESQRVMQQAYEYLTGEHEPLNYFGTQILDGQITTSVMNETYLSSSLEGMWGWRGNAYGVYELDTKFGDESESAVNAQVLYAGLGHIAWRVANPQPATP